MAEPELHTDLWSTEGRVPPRPITIPGAPVVLAPSRGSLSVPRWPAPPVDSPEADAEQPRPPRRRRRPRGQGGNAAGTDSSGTRRGAGATEGQAAEPEEGPDGETEAGGSTRTQAGTR